MESKGRNQWFDSPEFERQFHTELPPGALMQGGTTLFRIWSPTAQAVSLRLFSAGEGGAPFAEQPLQRQERGIWSAARTDCPSGTYYDYLVTAEGETRVTADPCARACGRNGSRSMVIDLSRTDPPGWAEDRAPEREPEAVIYELHIKDFSYDPACGVTPALRGKFLALTRHGTTLDGDGTHPTGLDYLRGLGVTHVQLMPVFDFGSVDEGGAESQYNWGYDPVNYNVPEGSYATDPCRGEVRIRELKQAVQALHQAGLRVIMDVVYNHTYQLDSWLWRTVPGYNIRQWPDGTPSNGSGCGCDLASERSMCGQYILNSVLYWAEEYHMDGFRFDLMGLLDVPLMNRIRTELDRRWGAGEKLILGEPWAAEDTACRPGTRLADKGHTHELDETIGVFCDATRDAVKGGMIDPASVGFVNGGGLTAEHLECCLRGWTGEYAAFSVCAPSQTISYLSSHDDWTLWDKLVLTMDPELRFETGTPEIFRANRLAAAICFCCQGYPFLLAGEEFGRTKLGVKNSYHASPELNRMDWRRAWNCQGLADYYRGLIALRRRCPGLRDKTRQAGARIGRVEQIAPDCVSAQVDNRGEADGWQTLLLCVNASGETVELPLPEGNWERLADGESSFGWQAPELMAGTAAVEAKTALILGQR